MGGGLQSLTTHDDKDGSAVGKCASAIIAAAQLKSPGLLELSQKQKQQDIRTQSVCCCCCCCFFSSLLGVQRIVPGVVLYRLFFSSSYSRYIIIKEKRKEKKKQEDKTRSSSREIIITPVQLINQVQQSVQVKYPGLYATAWRSSEPCFMQLLS